MILRLVCTIFGHRWRDIRVDYARWVMEGHENPLAGKDADCTRCGSAWRDFDRAATSARPLKVAMREAGERWQERGTCTAADGRKIARRRGRT